MDKVSKLKHTLYEVKMKIIHLEDLREKRGLNSRETAELEVLLTTRNKLDQRIEKLK